MARILIGIIRKVARAGLLEAGDDRPGTEEDAFAALQASEVDRRLRFPDPFKHTRRAAYLDGFSLHAGVRIHEHDRDGLEKLCRFAVRPPWMTYPRKISPGLGSISQWAVSHGFGVNHCFTRSGCIQAAETFSSGTATPH